MKLAKQINRRVLRKIETEENLDEELEKFPEGNILFASRVNFTIHN